MDTERAYMIAYIEILKHRAAKLTDQWVGVLRLHVDWIPEDGSRVSGYGMHQEKEPPVNSQVAGALSAHPQSVSSRTYCRRLASD
jgi:hypothetical protein